MELESNLINAYLQSYTLACEALVRMDFAEVSQNSKAPFDKEANTLCVKYLNRNYLVNCTTGEVRFEKGKDDITTPVKVLILHYLINAKPQPLSGQLISFKEVPGGGAIYYSTFCKRAVEPLAKVFASNYAALYKACEKLGGRKEKYGHASVTLNVFELVPVTYIVWEGDDEIPSSATILFDDSITSYLPGEDIVLAASYGVYELMTLAR